MESFGKHYNVEIKNGMLKLDDIAINVMHTANKKLFVGKIKEKVKIDGVYYISEARLKTMLESARSDWGKTQIKNCLNVNLKYVIMYKQ